MAGKRVVLITGASSGIGLETATVLSRRNFRVFGTRLPGEDFETRDFDLLELDVTSDDSVAACVEALMAQTDRLDVLHNNAGSGLLGPVEETSLEEARAVFEVNYFGAIRMINAVLPIMRRQRSGVIVNTSSVAGNVGVPFEAHYCATKLALASLTLGLRQEVAPFGIQVVLVAPGYVRTGFYDRLRTASGRLKAYDRGRARAVTAFERSARGGNEPAAIAKVIVRAIESRSPRPRYWAGADAALYGWAHRLLPDRLVDWIMRLQFHPSPESPEPETTAGATPEAVADAQDRA
jgi:NAD(P)-dependent dehydrogenase (short-subunit alcohol dehydrogenase family)